MWREKNMARIKTQLWLKTYTAAECPEPAPECAARLPLRFKGQRASDERIRHRYRRLARRRLQPGGYACGTSWKRLLAHLSTYYP